MAAPDSRKLAAILSADVVGYSRLMAEDEAATVAAVRELRERVPKIVAGHRGRLVDFTGDNFLVEFPTATEAVECAVELQRSIARENAEQSAGRRLRLRLGVHLGEVRVEDERLYGSGVNVASRLEGMAEHGGLCISSAIFDQVRRLSGLEFEDLGPREFKNIPDPVHVFRVHWHAAQEGPAQAALESSARPSVAVLPFANMSSDPDQDFFADGMAEELINALTQVEGLRVIARTSAFSFKGKNADVAEIGARLNVATVVEGSVRKAGDRIRITAQLVDVAGGHHLWSQVFDRSLTDVFEIQDEIAATIVRTITPKLLPEAKSLVGRPTASAEAYELFLRASEHEWRMTRAGFERGIELLEQAVRIDPDYAEAWARLGSLRAQMAFHFDPDERWYTGSEQAIARALELDPDVASAHVAHARLVWSPRCGFRNAESLRATARALELQPGSIQAMIWHGVVLFHVGLLDEGQTWISEALAAQPDDAFAHAAMGQVLLHQGRVDAAFEQIERGLAADPSMMYSHLFLPVVHVYRGDLARAESSLAHARRLVGEDPMLDAEEALLWARRGESERSEQLLARAMQERPSLGHTHHTWHYCAAAWALLGRTDRAIDRLRAASSLGLPSHATFRQDPLLASLHDTPGMKHFMTELELECSAYRREFGRHA